jgi:serine/threonine protein kinase
MPVPCTADEFVSLALQSGLLEQPTLARYRAMLPPDHAPGDNPAELARLLVRDGQLTQFQADQLLLGTCRRFLIGKYRILDRLGSGGMAQVYLGEHRHMKHRVAIKVLPPAKAQDPAAVERFLREARATAALNHPNIVRAHDIDQDDGLHFIVMEYIEGTSLLEMVLRHGPLHPQQAARYLRQAANGLQHAFEAGLVHRDIKPANLLVDRNGTVKILDLGLARFFADEKDNLSQKYNEAVIGTADYLAPEQVEDSHNIDIRADMYSLGATMYFCLTGQPPFPEGSFAQKLIWHQTRTAKPIREFRTDLPAELIALVEKMMAKNPAERFQTPAEIVAALAGVPVETGEPKTWETAILHADGTRKDGPQTPLPRRSPTGPLPVVRPRDTQSAKPRPLLPWAIAGTAMLLSGLALAGAYFLFPPAPKQATSPASTPAPPPTTERTEPRVTLEPVLIVHCGRGNGQRQDELVRAGYGYHLIQGTTFDAWPAGSTRTYCWYDPARLHFQVRVPTGAGVTLRLLFVDADSNMRRQKLSVQGRPIEEIADFNGAGRQVDVPVAGHEIPAGKIDVVLEKLAGANAVISQLEVLVPQSGSKR